MSQISTPQDTRLVPDASLAAMLGKSLKATPTTPFEQVPPTEAQQIQEIINLTRRLLEQRYPDGMTRRGVHPKDHGCVQATFTVDADLPPEYRVGVFAQPGKSYESWIRFSNATATVIGADRNDVNDGKASSRGMAIKLMNVTGETLLNVVGAKTQDFLMINLPMFAFADVAEYLELTRIQFTHHDNILPFFAPDSGGQLSAAKKRTLAILGRIQATALGNPLESPYFTGSPFLFGANAVAKFAVRPQGSTVTPVPANPSPSYLREALKRSLDTATGHPAGFDFLVQLRTQDSLSVEDASAEWPESIAPYRKVASLAIQPQDFDNPLRITQCEHLVFTPWHGLVEHRPLGGINRLRLGVYNASSQRRMQAREPGCYPPT